MTTVQAGRLGTWLEADPEYLLGQTHKPVRHPMLYHNAPQELWRALFQAVHAGTLGGVLILKCHQINLDRLPLGISNDDPRSMLAVVLTLKHTVGSYMVEGWQLWQPEPWSYPKSRAHVLSVLLLLQALDRLRHPGCYPRGLELSAKEMKAVSDGTQHVSSVLGNYRWLPKWDVETFLNLPARRQDIAASLKDYGDWRAWVTGTHSREG